MAYKLTYHTVAILLTMALDCVADVTNAMAGNGLFYALVKGFLGHAHQLTHFVRHLAYSESVARVTTETVEFCSAIHRHYVTFLKRGVVWNPMYHLVVHRGADACGKRITIRIREALKCWNCPIVADELVAALWSLQAG